MNTTKPWQRALFRVAQPAVAGFAVWLSLVGPARLGVPAETERSVVLDLRR
jgi:hypothetical protein